MASLKMPILLQNLKNKILPQISALQRSLTLRGWSKTFCHWLYLAIGILRNGTVISYIRRLPRTHPCSFFFFFFFVVVVVVVVVVVCFVFVFNYISWILNKIGCLNLHNLDGGINLNFCYFPWKTSFHCDLFCMFHSIPFRKISIA